MQAFAAFDFDGTLTKRDSLLQFLFFTHRWRAIPKLFRLTPFFLGFLLRITTRQKTKERVLKAFYGGMDMSQFQEFGKAFALGPLRSKILRKGEEALKWHQEQGHTLVLISASINTYLHPLAKHLGFDHAITSEVEVSQGVCTGQLKGKNCWGPEKVRRLKEILPENVHLYAYGDSRGDKELLELADEAHFRKFTSNSG